MALSANIHWQLRTDGLDTNGGGCKAEQSGSLLVSDASTNTDVSSSEYTFVSGDIGKTLYIVDGPSGWTIAAYSISSIPSAGVARLSGSVGGLSLKFGRWHMMAGTDYTDQASPQLALTDLACNNNTTLTSVTGGFTAAMVGNLIQIASGTNFTAGFYEVTARTDTNTVTLDRNPTTGASASSGVGKLGGSLLTPVKVFGAGAQASGHNVWIKAGNYTLTAGVTLVAGASGAWSVVSGFNSTRGDLNNSSTYASHPVILSPGNVGTMVLIAMASSTHLRNVVVDGTTGATKGYRGITAGAANSCMVTNCKATGMSNIGFMVGTGMVVDRCYASATVSGGIGGFYLGAAYATLTDCRATANATPGFYFASSVMNVTRCIADANTGASTDGFYIAGTYGVALMSCVAYNNGRDGIRIDAANAMDYGAIRNCILCSNGAYGIRSASTTWKTALSDYNAFYGNTSGERSGWPAGPHDVTLTGVPFTAAGSDDFTLDSTAGEGTACKNAGFPGATQWGTGYADIGALRHVDPSGGGGVSRSRIMGGG